ncbi:hypothetical protein BRYFOR_09816 [Marvinbryantia formatexigens DSM 14469]|uniref:Uncharacterized protein n=1 Tax=Marvinbryantia formatexigens DSM 14469 TaxID=478749 RepID=C6LMB7_9FIRM|nr:hypothetical protein BRYFOR_09816 [Marvinbryantia formatexigens DSM 14469]
MSLFSRRCPCRRSLLKTAEQKNAGGTGPSAFCDIFVHLFYYILTSFS